jgi:hypothetical protein
MLCGLLVYFIVSVARTSVPACVTNYAIFGVERFSRRIFISNYAYHNDSAIMSDSPVIHIGRRNTETGNLDRRKTFGILRIFGRERQGLLSLVDNLDIFVTREEVIGSLHCVSANKDVAEVIRANIYSQRFTKVLEDNLSREVGIGLGWIKYGMRYPNIGSFFPLDLTSNHIEIENRIDERTEQKQSDGRLYTISDREFIPNYFLTCVY